jgi:periplasmic protein TonB
VKVLSFATLASLLLHGAILFVAKDIKARKRVSKPKKIRMKIVNTKPKKAKPIAPVKLAEKPKPKPKPKPKTAKVKKKKPRVPVRKDKKQPAEAPAPSKEAPPPKPTPPPMGFSVDMSSTVIGGGVAARAIAGGGNMFADPTDGSLAPGKKTNERVAPADGDGKGSGRGELQDRPPEFITSEFDRVPPYPAEARKNDIEGRVMLRVYVGASGRVEKVRVIKGIGYGCDKSAVRHAKKYWRFRPAIQEGSAVGMWIPVPVTFVLDR